MDKNLSMLPVCDYLSKKINLEVELVKEKIFNIDPNLLFKNDSNKIIFLENIRFYEQEEKNSDEFAKKFYLILGKYILMMLFLVLTELMPRLTK